MKYWENSETEYLEYEEAGRILPYKHPAAIAASDDIRTEVEIIPNTMEFRDYVDPMTFTTSLRKCVKVERRLFRFGKDMLEEIVWIPLDMMGYDEPPNNYAVFDRAMEII